MLKIFVLCGSLIASSSRAIASNLLIYKGFCPVRTDYALPTKNVNTAADSIILGNLK